MTAPDLILCGARVHGVDGAEAVAIAGERIAAVGGRAGMLALRGPATRVVDLPRALICPGFHDAHAHLFPLAEARREIDLHGKSLVQMRDAVAAVAAARQPGRWIVGRGYDPELFRAAEADGTTARSLLDPATVHHPVLLRSHDYHSVALNSVGLKMTGFLGVAGATPDEPIEGAATDRDAAGEPTGVLRENAALSATLQCNDLTPDELARGGIEACIELVRAGITAIHEMSGSRRHDLLRRIDDARCLPLDVYGTLSPTDAPAPPDAPESQSGGGTLEGGGGRRFRISGMKAFLDGALGSRTALLLAPYEGETCHCGIEVLPREQARESVAAAAAAGLPSYLHAIGDAAVRTALDVLCEARGPGGARLRHRVEHAQMIHDDDLPRFVAHGIVASVQPVHMALDAPLVHRHWGARSREAFPLRRLLDSGACVAFGSDAPIETFDVVEGIACAVRRRGRDGTELHAQEAVTVAEAIDAYTSGAAWAVGAERASGAIRTGGVASLTVLSEDVVSHAEALGDTRVAATVVRGLLLHEAESAPR